MKRLVLILVIASLFIASFLMGCARQSVKENSTGQLVVYSPHPLEFIDPIVGEFESEYGIQVNVIFAGTGELLSRIEGEATRPQCDVLWGGSISTLEPKKELFETYKSRNEDYVLPEYKNKDGHITRFSLIPSVIMTNKNLIGNMEIKGYNDLLQDSLYGKIAMADPQKSSSAYEHLINQLYAMGEGNPEDGWWYVDEFVKQLDGKLLDGSPEVYRGVADGKFAVGLTFEEAAAIYVKSGAPVEIIYPIEGTIVKADGVVIVKNSPNLENAKLFIDFVTSSEIQGLIATELNRRPIRNDIHFIEGLRDLNDIYLISDDENWSASERISIIEAFKQKFQGE